jgi:hypothetical protein
MYATVCAFLFFPIGTKTMKIPENCDNYYDPIVIITLTL